MLIFNIISQRQCICQDKVGYVTITNNPPISMALNNKGLFLPGAICLLQRKLCSHLTLFLTLECKLMEQPLPGALLLLWDKERKTLKGLSLKMKCFFPLTTPHPERSEPPQQGCQEVPSHAAPSMGRMGMFGDLCRIPPLSFTWGLLHISNKSGLGYQ